MKRATGGGRRRKNDEEGRRKKRKSKEDDIKLTKAIWRRKTRKELLSNEED